MCSNHIGDNHFKQFILVAHERPALFCDVSLTEIFLKIF